jgi:branched-chain amino acid aminotransferase
VFLVDDDDVLTPTSRACPEGITRATVIDLCRQAGRVVREGDWTLTQVYNADEVFVTGTMGGLTPVTTVDGRQIGTGKPGPVTEALGAAYAEITARSGTPV